MGKSLSESELKMLVLVNRITLGRLYLYGVILNGLQAVKDLAWASRNVGPLNAPEEPQTCQDPRQILHPAEAGFRMTSVSEDLGSKLSYQRLQQNPDWPSPNTNTLIDQTSFNNKFRYCATTRGQPLNSQCVQYWAESQ